MTKNIENLWIGTNVLFVGSAVSVPFDEFTSITEIVKLVFYTKILKSLN